MKFKFIFVLCLLILSVGFSGPVAARDRLGLTVSPFMIEETRQAGQSFTRTITLTNTSNEKHIFYSFLQDFTVKDESGEVRLLPAGSDDFSLNHWLDIPLEKIELLSGQSQKITVNFDIPERAAPGGYYAAVIFSSELPQFEDDQPAGSIMVGLAHQVGVLIFLNLSKGAIEEADLIQFSTDKSHYQTPFQVNFMTRIKNQGNVHLKPGGLIRIKNIFGREVAVLPFNPEGYIILPKTIRRFEQLWEGSLAFGKYEASVFFNFGTPVEQGGPGIQALSGQTSFWIMPWKIIIISLLIFFGLAVFVWLLIKRYQKACQKIYHSTEK